MKKVNYQPHTADIQLKIEADTLEELFAGALEGMNHILKTEIPLTKIDRKEGVEVVITSLDVTTLLIDFLSEILTDSYVKKKIFVDLNVIEIKNHFIRAMVYGIPVDSFDDDIKAVTYHMAKVIQSPSGKWETNIIFDI